MTNFDTARAPLYCESGLQRYASQKLGINSASIYLSDRTCGAGARQAWHRMLLSMSWGLGRSWRKTIPCHADLSPTCYPPALPQSRQSQNQSTAIGPMDCDGSNGAYHTDRRSLRILPIIGVSLELKRPSRCSSM